MQPRSTGPDAPSQRSPAIWLADAARALSALRPDDEGAAAIAELLGLMRAVPTTAVAAAAPAPPARPAQPDRVRPVGPARQPPPPPPGEPAPTRRPAVVAALPARASAAPPVRLPQLADVLARPPARVALPPAGLLTPLRQRAVLSSAVSTRAPSGELDVAAIVDTLVTGRPLVALPQLERATTRRGLQLLIDLGAAMTPFDADQRQLRIAIEQVIGPDGLQVLRFRDSPLADIGAGIGPVWDWRPYLPPTTPRPIMIVGDLGLLTPDGFHPDWARFAQLCRDARCPLVALVPAPAHRIPPDVHRVLAVLPWDRSTTVRDGVHAAQHAERSRS